MTRAVWTNRKLRIGVVIGAVLASATAVAFPWDIDMFESQAVDGYEREMAPPPEGAVAQPDMLTPRDLPPLPEGIQARGPQAEALTSPLEPTAEVIAEGGQLYQTYCYPCHGDESGVGPVGEAGRVPGVIPYAGLLSGNLATLSDGGVYLTIRNGGLAIMPSYGWAMNEREMWSIVHWLREQQGGSQ